MRGPYVLSLIAGSLMLQGCIANAAFDVVTAPVRIASKAVDLVTTSQSESDEKRGREMRESEERLGKLQRRYNEHQADCADGNRRACEKAQEIQAEM